MKVLHLGIFDRQGGACIAAFRQHLALRQAGVESAMWVRFKVTNDPHVHPFAPSLSLPVRLSRRWRRRTLERQHNKYLRHGEYFDDRAEHGGNELTGLPPADVINVQFGWEFLDFPGLFRQLPSSVPLVVTMHEMATFTGGCSYAGDCTGFLKQCGKCPLMGGNFENDLSRQSWIRKQFAYQHRAKGKLHFVADSHWLAQQARQSSLLTGQPVSVIHYGLDTSVFRPLDRAMCRSLLDIPSDARVISFAAASVSDERKGVTHLIEALRLLPQKPFLLTWGNNFPPALTDIPHRHLGPIGEEHFMAMAYNAADIFVMPSRQEAFGQTALESIACGTPVAAFAAGGIPDSVRHEETGLLAKVGDSAELSCAISRLLEDKNLWKKLSERGRSVAVNEFSMGLNAQKYSELYRNLLADG